MSEHAQDIDMSTQRQDPRIAVYAAGRLRSAEGTERACELLNISAGGAMVRIEGESPVGDDFVLDLPEVGEFPARAAWRHNSFIGLAFLERVDDVEEIVRAISAIAQAAEEKRRFRRVSVLWRGRLYAAGKTHEVRVLNVSPGGAKLRGPALPENTAVILTVDRAGDVPARVVWCEREQIGLRFLDSSQEVCEIFRDLLPSMRTRG